MPCGPSCVCLGTDVECLSVVDPSRFGFFCDWCASGDEAKRRHVLERSRIGIVPPPETAPCDPEPTKVPAAPQIPLAGDIVAMAAHRIGADRLAKWVAAKLGKDDCNCEARRIALNRLDASLRRYLARGDR